MAERELQEETFGTKAEARGITAEGHVRTRHLAGSGDGKSQTRSLEDDARESEREVAENRQWARYVTRVPSTDEGSGANGRMEESGKGGTGHCDCELIVMSKQGRDGRSVSTSRECWSGMPECWCVR